MQETFVTKPWNGRELHVLLNEIHGYSLDQMQVNDVYSGSDISIQQRYGLDSPVFSDLDGSAEHGGHTIAVDAEKFLLWQGARIEGASALAHEYLTVFDDADKELRDSMRDFSTTISTYQITKIQEEHKANTSPEHTQDWQLTKNILQTDTGLSENNGIFDSVYWGVLIVVILCIL